jgi:hypothetical protein
MTTLSKHHADSTRDRNRLEAEPASWEASQQRINDLEDWCRVVARNIDLLYWTMRGAGSRCWHSVSRSACGRRAIRRAMKSRCFLMRRQCRSVVFTRFPMAASPRRMLMAIPVVIVPDGADVARVGLEKEFWYGEHAGRIHAADGTGRRSGRFRHRPLPLVLRPAGGANVVVFRHRDGRARR